MVVPFLGPCLGSFLKFFVSGLQKRNVLVSMKLCGLWRPDRQLGRPFMCAFRFDLWGRKSQLKSGFACAGLFCSFATLSSRLAGLPSTLFHLRNFLFCCNFHRFAASRLLEAVSLHQLRPKIQARQHSLPTT